MVSFISILFSQCNKLSASCCHLIFYNGLIKWEYYEIDKFIFRCVQFVFFGVFFNHFPLFFIIFYSFQHFLIFFQSHRSVWENMQTVAEEKRKAYRCVCWSAKLITKEILLVCDCEGSVCGIFIFIFIFIFILIGSIFLRNFNYKSRSWRCR